MSQPAYQLNAYQNNAYQVGFDDVSAFDGCAFQFNAFQAAPCPVPPEPIMDGHDGGRRKKALKKLKELEEARINMIREQAEHRKMLIRHAIDPEAKAEYEAKIAAEKAQPATKVVEAQEKKIAKIDDRIEKLSKDLAKLEIQGIIAKELATIHSARMAHQAEIARQIRQADDELALMMLM